MNDSLFSLARSSLRNTDSNSLLRLYDAAQEILHKSPVQVEQAKASKAAQRIAEELRKRRVSF